MQQNHFCGLLLNLKRKYLKCLKIFKERNSILEQISQNVKKIFIFIFNSPSWFSELCRGKHSRLRLRNMVFVAFVHSAIDLERYQNINVLTFMFPCMVSDFSSVYKLPIFILNS